MVHNRHRDTKWHDSLVHRDLMLHLLLGSKALEEEGSASRIFEGEDDSVVEELGIPRFEEIQRALDHANLGLSQASLLAQSLTPLFGLVRSRKSLRSIDSIISFTAHANFEKPCILLISEQRLWRVDQDLARLEGLVMALKSLVPVMHSAHLGNILGLMFLHRE